LEAHPVAGERICAPLQSWKDVLPIIRWHHERLDGSGYPDHLQGAKIPRLVRILQVVDIYDSLVSVRSFRPAMTDEQAFAMMRNEVRRGWRDAALVDELQRLFENQSALPEIRPPRKDWASLQRKLFETG
jgi:putative two-component system response regulator